MPAAARSPLISAGDLARRLGAPDLLVADCRFDLADPAAGHAAWCGAHLPGAHHVDLDRDLSAPVSPGGGGRHPLPARAALARRFGALGIGPRTTVVAYDDAGGFFAARLWWLLRWMGHGRVQVLDGGLAAWTAAGAPVDDGPPAERTAQPFVAGAPAMPVIDAQAVAHGLAADSLLLLDVRAPERFRGDVEPLDRVGGHVPGAVNHPLAGNLDAARRFRAPAELRARFDALRGDRPPDEIAVMCGSGVSACHTLVALELAGLPGAALYAGSWSDWVADPARPVATGA